MGKVIPISKGVEIRASRLDAIVEKRLVPILKRRLKAILIRRLKECGFLNPKKD
jgi:hypothetical protein